MPKQLSMLTRASLVTAMGVAGLALVASPASAVTIVQHTNTFDQCHFEPGDVPGVDVAFTATCTFVHEPSPKGNLQVVARADLPKGYTLTETFRGTVNCSFNGVESTGIIVATKSGKVVSECRVPGGA